MAWWEWWETIPFHLIWVTLALAIVSAIARAHGGTCTVEALPRGVRFSLWLPGFEPAVAQTATAASTAARSVLT